MMITLCHQARVFCDHHECDETETLPGPPINEVPAEEFRREAARRLRGIDWYIGTIEQLCPRHAPGAV